jgi:uncharacterized protein (UPF0548 family)
MYSTRSGFAVTSFTPDIRVREGTDYLLTVRFGPVAVREPIRVVAVINQSVRCGFSYGTRSQWDQRAD